MNSAVKKILFKHMLKCLALFVVILIAQNWIGRKNEEYREKALQNHTTPDKEFRKEYPLVYKMFGG